MWFTLLCVIVPVEEQHRALPAILRHLASELGPLLLVLLGPKLRKKVEPFSNILKAFCNTDLWLDNSFQKEEAAHDLMKPPKLLLAISNNPSITPVPAVIRINKTSIMIRTIMESQK